jgi:hypothetical protein
MDPAFLPIIQHSYDLNRWLLVRIARLPRSHKFTLGDRIQGTALDLVLALTEAAHARARDRPLHRASRLLDQLRLLLRLCHDIGLLEVGAFQHVSERQAEIGRMLGGWLRATRGSGGVGTA